MWISGMGAEVQSNMHFRGCHSTRDLNDKGGYWPIYNTSKTLKNGEYHKLFSTKPSSDAFLEHDKGTVRQTILNHESVFRHQLCELHRLYKKQIDLMNGIKTNKLENQSDPASMSQSIFSSPSARFAPNRKRWHVSAFPLALKPGTESIDSHFDTKDKIMKSSCDYSRDGETMQDCDLDSKWKKAKRLLIDLELPADEHICSDEELDISAVSRVESCWGDENLSCGRNLTLDCHSEHGKTSNYGNQFYGSFFPENRRASLGSSLVQNSVTSLDQRKAEHQNNRRTTIFGVEISDTDQNAYAVASHSTCSHSDFTNFAPFSGSTQSRRPSALSQLSPAEERHFSNTSADLNKGLVSRNTDSRYHIDLNIRVTEEVEEAQLRPSSPKIDVNISAEIDLEMTVAGAEIGASVTPAAEALVAMSSSRAQGDIFFNISEASSCDSLIWFAEIASTHKDDIENELKVISVVNDDEEQCRAGMDYFELMTLALTDTKVEKYHIEPHSQEDRVDKSVLSSKRRRTGQARRGRQRKDFMRDILPGLIPLPRHEVTDDLQIIEALIGETGGTWRARLTRRKNAGNGGRGKGRRNSACATQTETRIQQSRNLMSWGKTTRRLPRPRCSNLGSSRHHREL